MIKGIHLLVARNEAMQTFEEDTNKVLDWFCEDKMNTEATGHPPLFYGRDEVYQKGRPPR